ncbi:flagellin [Pseudomonas sp.]|uniref:flagellin N-terminal helical domain-containing protein n=1 Tax=Pseudomonas sp. TaxID=306 RepID=UPI00260DC504|nr:flagellin [Pseudomonas sp.]
MALSVNTNVTSQTVQKNLNKAGDALSTSMNRLSSGLKINSAKDDAAGLQMANRLTSQTKGMTVAIANANNGTSIAQTAEGAMQESTNILQRLRELALQASNGDKSAADRSALQQEFTAKTGELTRIAQTTTFGGRNLLDGSFQNQSFQVGADANQTISFGMSDVSATGLKGTFSEASVAGAAMKNLSASTTGSVLKSASFGPTTTTTTVPAVPGTTTTTATAVGTAVAGLETATNSVAFTLPADTLTIDGNDVTLTATMTGAELTDAIEAADVTGKLKATIDGTTGALTLTSDTAFEVGGTAVGKVGLTAQNNPATPTTTGGTPASTTTKTVGLAVPSLATGGTSKLAATDDITINNKKVGVTAGMSGADLAAAIMTADTSVTAVFDAGKGVMTLTSTTGAVVVGGADAAKAGLAEIPAVEGQGPTKVGTTAMEKEGSITVNGQEVKWDAGDTINDVLKTLKDVEGIASATLNAEGRIELKSTDGQDVKLANGQGGSLAQLGLSAGTSQAKLTADTSIELNGVEVKFKKGDTADSIVSSINSASTGVIASKNADGTLKLFSNKDITVKDGAAGTGLEALGLKDAAAADKGTGKTTATTVETTVSDLSVLTAADAQRTVQALAEAIQQIDTQRSALGAVQNRFTSTVANLQSISENSSAALGRVQDTDFASEAAELTKQQTMQQASTAILSQANQLPSAVMKLLQ